MHTLTIAKEVFQIEADAITKLSAQLTEDFGEAVSSIQH